jgi:amidophosphoribosyltransferase
MRPACPPLAFGCKFLNFSRSRSVMDLAARKAIRAVERREPSDVTEYADPDSAKYAVMVERIRKRLKLSTLRYQRLDDLVSAIGLPACKLCTYCWSGRE